MRILLIGSGGREHALSWKMSQSPSCTELYIAPGNAGTAKHGENIPVQAMDFEGIKNILIEKKIDLIVIGPDDPLGLGIVDFLRIEPKLHDLAILGPVAAGAKLEASKAFAKEFMKRHSIPTAGYMAFTRDQRAQTEIYLSNHTLPIVMKADGLAAGKGVSICASVEEAFQFIQETWDENKFGESGAKIVIEEFLDGIELSVFILTDGNNYVLLPEAKDYKRIGESDKGENTGGMGAISPVPFADSQFMDKVKSRIISPTLKGLQFENIDYRGFIFFGLIMVKGEPFVIEYNARLGDPETQVIMPRIKSDIVPLLYNTARKDLIEIGIEISEQWAAGVIAVSEGYPGNYEKGHIITGLEGNSEVLIFQAGTKEQADEVITSGGRVCAVVSMDDTLTNAIKKAFDGIKKLHFKGMKYRTDIGKDLIEFSENNKLK